MNLLNKFIKYFLKSDASKWGKGTSVLWRGNTFLNFINSYFDFNKNIIKSFKNFFLFESCRVGIYHYSKFLGIGHGDDVQICAFTCDAVTKSIEALGCNITLYDCNEDMRCEALELKSNTKLVICQISFGIQSISDEQIRELEKKGIHVLFDKALSYGQEDFNAKNLNNFTEVYSFEVSKSFTVGWGGALKINCPKLRGQFTSYYKSLSRVNIFKDLYRVFSTSLNLFMCRNGNYFFYLIWLLLRICNIHRQSRVSSYKNSRDHPKIGLLSEKILLSSFLLINEKLNIANKNHDFIKKQLNLNNFKVISNVNKRYSSPRVVFLVSEEEKSLIKDLFKNKKIEVGFWYNELPMKYEDNKLINTKQLMNRVINLPCHWSLTKNELKSIGLVINKIVHQKKTDTYL